MPPKPDCQTAGNQDGTSAAVRGRKIVAAAPTRIDSPLPLGFGGSLSADFFVGLTQIRGRPAHSARSVAGAALRWCSLRMWW